MAQIASVYMAGVDKLPLRRRRPTSARARPLTEARIARKATESQLEALANRIAYLRAEEEKAGRVIAETKRRTQEVLRKARESSGVNGNDSREKPSSRTGSQTSTCAPSPRLAEDVAAPPTFVPLSQRTNQQMPRGLGRSSLSSKAPSRLPSPPCNKNHEEALQEGPPEDPWVHHPPPQPAPAPSPTNQNPPGGEACPRPPGSPSCSPTPSTDVEPSQDDTWHATRACLSAGTASATAPCRGSTPVDEPGIDPAGPGMDSARGMCADDGMRERHLGKACEPPPVDSPGIDPAGGMCAGDSMRDRHLSKACEAPSHMGRQRTASSSAYETAVSPLIASEKRDGRRTRRQGGAAELASKQARERRARGTEPKWWTGRTREGGEAMEMYPSLERQKSEIEYVKSGGDWGEVERVQAEMLASSLGGHGHGHARKGNRAREMKRRKGYSMVVSHGGEVEALPHFGRSSAGAALRIGTRAPVVASDLRGEETFGSDSRFRDAAGSSWRGELRDVEGDERGGRPSFVERKWRDGCEREVESKGGHGQVSREESLLKLTGCGSSAEEVEDGLTSGGEGRVGAGEENQGAVVEVGSECQGGSVVEGRYGDGGHGDGGSKQETTLLQGSDYDGEGREEKAGGCVGVVGQLRDGSGGNVAEKESESECFAAFTYEVGVGAWA